MGRAGQDARDEAIPARRGIASTQRSPLRASKTTLAMLISAGVLREGERLYASLEGVTHTEPKQFEAELVGGGMVRIVSDGGDGSLNGEEFSSPSAAITALYDRPDSGWMNWSVDRRGRRFLLETIRDRWETSQAATPE